MASFFLKHIPVRLIKYYTNIILFLNCQLKHMSLCLADNICIIIGSGNQIPTQITCINKIHNYVLLPHGLPIYMTQKLSKCAQLQ